MTDYSLWCKLEGLSSILIVYYTIIKLYKAMHQKSHYRSNKVFQIKNCLWDESAKKKKRWYHNSSVNDADNLLNNPTSRFVFQKEITKEGREAPAAAAATTTTTITTTECIGISKWKWEFSLSFRGWFFQCWGVY